MVRVDITGERSRKSADNRRRSRRGFIRKTGGLTFYPALSTPVLWQYQKNAFDSDDFTKCLTAMRSEVFV